MAENQKKSEKEEPKETIEEGIEKVAKEMEQKVEEISQKVDKAVKEKRGSGRFVWAMFLIFMGFVLLLNTTGLVPWGIWWYLLRFWPVFLILAGIQIILGKSKITGFLVGTMALILFILIGFTALIAMNAKLLSDLKIEVPNWWTKITVGIGEEKTYSYKIKEDDYSEIDKREINIDVGAGSFDLKDNKSSDFFSLDAKYYEGYGEPEIKESERKGTLEIGFKQKTKTAVSISRGPQYSLTLGQPNIDTDVKIDLGAGKGTIELDNLALRDLSAEVGAGNLEISLKGNTASANKIKINVGAGKAKLTLPKEVGYKLTYSVGVGSIEIEGKNLGKIGTKNKDYQSDNYEDAEIKANIEADVGVGKFELERK